jgi:competence protein ComEC
VDFSVLHPAESIYAEDRKRKENDRGCVVKVATRASSALLTGDVEARSEREMLARDAGALRAAVLLVPHHGSKTSSTPEFIEAVAPEIGLLSVGYRNRFHHPNPAVVGRYVQRRIELHRTDREGALHLELPARLSDPARVQNQAPKMRYWSARRRDSWTPQ